MIIFCRRVAFFAMMSALSSVAEAQSLPVFQPSGAWTINASPQACEITRSFSGHDRSIRLRFIQAFSPFAMRVDLEGEGVQGFGDANAATIHVGSRSYTTDWFRSSSNFGDPTIRLVGTWSTLPEPPVDDSGGTLRILRGDTELASLSLRSMKPVLDSLRSCQDQLYDYHGISISDMRRVVVDATPVGSRARWVTTDDLPAQFRAMRGVRTVSVRLDIGPDGRPSNCAVRMSSGEAVLDQEACRHLLRRARFNPARDSSGNPIRTIQDIAVAWEALR